MKHHMPSLEKLLTIFRMVDQHLVTEESWEMFLDASRPGRKVPFLIT